MMDAQGFIFVTQWTHENTGLHTDKVVAFKEHEPGSRIAVMCVSDLSEPVMQMACQWHRQNVRHSGDICDKNLIHRNEEPDGVIEPGASRCLSVQDGLASAVDHVNADDATNQNVIRALSHLLKRSLEGKPGEGGGWNQHGKQNKKYAFHAFPRPGSGITLRRGVAST
ncbi:hypothetical protein [Stenotrophomonas sp.]|uniref:hypothetical protein n=1 Tax=Stenotrophomonas sp. TaxID=69392 RepID=UPI0028A6FB1C|nr:hypothetical protein [Stenotrophomonas sp.]